MKAILVLMIGVAIGYVAAQKPAKRTRLDNVTWMWHMSTPSQIPHPTRQQQL